VPSPKGASTHITYFSQALVEAGYEVTLITAGDESLPEQETYAGATILRVPPGQDLNFLKRALAFGEYVLKHISQAEPYHIAHFRSIWSGLPLAQAREYFGYKLLYEVNGLPSIEMKYHYPALRNTPTLKKIDQQETTTLTLADAIICPSQVTRTYLSSRDIPADKITVIPNGVDIDRFQSNTNALEASESQKVLLYIGTLADWQGLDTLLEAMPLVLARQPTACLRIIGRGRKRQRKTLAKRIRKLNLEQQVTVEDSIPHAEMPALIAQAGVGVAPLGCNDRNVTQGCCPLKILEYMAAGRPIVASNLPVVRELVRPDREALLFTPNDPEDLAHQILTILDDPTLAATLTTNATTRARQQFTWAIAQQKLLEVYNQL